MSYVRNVPGSMQVKFGVLSFNANNAMNESAICAQADTDRQTKVKKKHYICRVHSVDLAVYNNLIEHHGDAVARFSNYTASQ